MTRVVARPSQPTALVDARAGSRNRIASGADRAASSARRSAGRGTGSLKIEIVSAFCAFSRRCKSGKFPSLGPPRRRHDAGVTRPSRPTAFVDTRAGVGKPDRGQLARWATCHSPGSSPGAARPAARPGTRYCRFAASGPVILISGRGFNLFKPLRRHFRATSFCVSLSRRDPGISVRQWPNTITSAIVRRPDFASPVRTPASARRRARLRRRDPNAVFVGHAPAPRPSK